MLGFSLVLRSDIGEETRKFHSNPGYAFQKHIKQTKNASQPFQHEEDPLNNKMQSTMSKISVPNEGVTF